MPLPLSCVRISAAEPKQAASSSQAGASGSVVPMQCSEGMEASGESRSRCSRSTHGWWVGMAAPQHTANLFLPERLRLPCEVGLSVA